MTLECPSCEEDIDFGSHSLERIEGCTVDCPNCETLLIIEEGHALDFHEHLHSQDERWPIDGKGTACLAIKEIE